MTDSDIAQFIDCFYGYGTYELPLWFIGIEEGGGNRYEDVEKRVDTWKERGKLELENLQPYHSAIDVPRWFGERTPLQPYWRRLMRIGMLAQGEEPTNDKLREIQRTTLGSKSHPFICILELMPIPCKSTNDWPLSGRTTLPELQFKKAYIERIAPRRAIHLRGKAQQHKPTAVIFCSSDSRFRIYWNDIV